MKKIMIILMSSMTFGAMAQETTSDYPAIEVSKIGSFISDEKANTMASNYQIANPEGVFTHTVGKDVLNEMLSQDGVEGIRVYQALDDEGTLKLVIVGVDKFNNNTGKASDHNPGLRCPPRCKLQTVVVENVAEVAVD